ncbi:hypothetical protein X943_000093 [Babesia divergens]|uniref:Mechanosensitive ion channel MscS domain-containing protein n=1 Tax=Babesia divergens TaxID=32595 RepID=A0AAD9GH06_BABDI|nr:hypothetical protein X943_000093 [Babesia divergens]
MMVNRKSKGNDVDTLIYMQSNSEEPSSSETDASSNTASTAEAEKCVETAVEYDDTDDQLLDSNWRNPWDWFVHDFLHDLTALWFLAVHVLCFFLCIFFAPMISPVKLASREALNRAIAQELGSDVGNFSNVTSMGVVHLHTIRNAMCFVFATIVTYTLTLIAVLLTRYLIIKLFVQRLYSISRLAIVITYAVDPAASYCIWAIINYALFRGYTKPLMVDPATQFYYFLLFGRRMSKLLIIDQRCYAWANSVCHLQILIAVRRLVLSSLLFLFELTFLPNYSAELKCFLKDQALLRRLHFLKKARESNNPEVLHSVEEARAAVENIPLPETPIIYDHHVYYASDNFKIFRPTIHGWLYQKQLACDMNRKIEEVAQFYKDSWIKQCSSNFLTNWSALHDVVHNPPELLFMDYYVPLTSKNTVQDYSRLLFDHMYETMSALNHSATQPTQPSPRTNASTSEPEIEPLRSSKTNVEIPLHVLISRKTARFSAEPLVARSKSNVHLLRMLTNASDSEDDVANEKQPDTRARSSQTLHEDRRCLTPKMFSCLNSPVVDEFFAEYDIGNCGSISSDVFVRNVLYMCSLRKRLMSTLKNQRSILCLVARLLSTVLWFLIFVLFLMTFRVNKNIVLPSTIGFFSAMIVALSHMYTSFITAIIFVVLSNPYNVGDRVRINEGEPMYVKSITTYNTKFRCIHGKEVTYQNSILSTLRITNETRARHAAQSMAIRVGGNTTPAALKQLMENLKGYVNSQPRNFVKDGCYIYRSDIQVGHYYILNVVLTYLENWSTTNTIFLLRKQVVLELARQCNMLGITYKKPIEHVTFCNTLNYTDKSSTD